MKLHIQPGDTVWTIYNGVLQQHIVIERTAYFARLSSKRYISYQNLFTWKNLALATLKWYRFKHWIRSIAS